MARTAIALTSLLLAAAAHAAPADTVYRNGYIYTVDAQDSVQQALAVRAGRIVYVGDNAGAQAHTGHGAGAGGSVREAPCQRSSPASACPSRTTGPNSRGRGWSTDAGRHALRTPGADHQPPVECWASSWPRTPSS